jgi:hypothetical protein
MGTIQYLFSNRHGAQTKTVARKCCYSQTAARNSARCCFHHIEAWIAYWKREFALQHKNKDWKFQSRGWHHRIRNGENHSDKWRYIQENPVRKGLVKNSEGWRFKGRVFDLMWTGR